MADLTYHNDGNYYWYTWSPSESNMYDYHVRLACNSYHDGGTYFNMFTTLPNVNAPENGEKVLIMNGGIAYYYQNVGYNQGPEITWYGRIQQEFGFASTDPSVRLAVASRGSSLNIDTINNMESQNYPILVGAPSNIDGCGESGVLSTRSHSFAGYGDDGTNYFGYVLGSNDDVEGQTGMQVVLKMTGLYGGKCCILDGGGSTQFWANGSIVKPSTDSGGVRNIKNALVLYKTIRKCKIDIEQLGRGSISGSGSYVKGESVTLTAIPDSNFTFAGWDDGSSIITTNPYTFSAQTDKIFIARFIEKPKYTVTGYCENGTITGLGQYYNGDNVSIQCIPNEGYEFIKWDDDNIQNPRTFTINSNKNFTAVVSESGVYKLSVNINPNGSGNISDQRESNTHVLTATPLDNHFNFLHWEYNGSTLTNNPLTITLSTNSEIIAVFEELGYSVTANINIPDSGTVKGVKKYLQNEQVILIAVPNGDYDFVNWTDINGNILSTDTHYSFIMGTENITINANFQSIADLHGNCIMA